MDEPVLLHERKRRIKGVEFGRIPDSGIGSVRVGSFIQTAKVLLASMATKYLRILEKFGESRR